MSGRRSSSGAKRKSLHEDGVEKSSKKGRRESSRELSPVPSSSATPIKISIKKTRVIRPSVRRSPTASVSENPTAADSEARFLIASASQTPAVSEGSSPAGSQGSSPAASQASSPAASQASSPAASQGSSPAASRSGSPAPCSTVAAKSQGKAPRVKGKLAEKEENKGKIYRVSCSDI